MFSRKMNGVQRLHMVDKKWAAVMRPGNVSKYSRTSLKQYYWDRGFGIELERLLN